MFDEFNFKLAKPENTVFAKIKSLLFLIKNFINLLINQEKCFVKIVLSKIKEIKMSSF